MSKQKNGALLAIKLLADAKFMQKIDMLPEESDDCGAPMLQKIFENFSFENAICIINEALKIGISFKSFAKWWKNSFNANVVFFHSSPNGRACSLLSATQFLKQIPNESLKEVAKLRRAELKLKLDRFNYIKWTQLHRAEVICYWLFCKNITHEERKTRLLECITEKFLSGTSTIWNNIDEASVFLLYNWTYYKEDSFFQATVYRLIFEMFQSVNLHSVNAVLNAFLNTPTSKRCSVAFPCLINSIVTLITPDMLLFDNHDGVILNQCAIEDTRTLIVPEINRIFHNNTNALFTGIDMIDSKLRMLKENGKNVPLLPTLLLCPKFNQTDSPTMILIGTISVKLLNKIEMFPRDLNDLKNNWITAQRVLEHIGLYMSDGAKTYWDKKQASIALQVPDINMVFSYTSTFAKYDVVQFQLYLRQKVNGGATNFICKTQFTATTYMEELFGKILDNFITNKDNMKFSDTFINWITTLKPCERLVCVFSLLKGFVYGDGSYNLKSGIWRIDLKNLGRDHPTLLSFQKILSLIDLIPNVKGNCLHFTQYQSELLSILFSAFGILSSVRKCAHLFVAPNMGPKFESAKRAVGSNVYLHEALLDAIIFEKSGVSLLSQLTCANKYSCQSKPFVVSNFKWNRHQISLFNDQSVKDIGIWPCILNVTNLNYVDEILHRPLQLGFMESITRMCIFYGRTKERFIVEEWNMISLFCETNKNIKRGLYSWLGPYCLTLAKKGFVEIRMVLNNETGETDAAAFKFTPMFCKFIFYFATIYAAPISILDNLENVVLRNICNRWAIGTVRITDAKQKSKILLPEKYARRFLNSIWRGKKAEGRIVVTFQDELTDARFCPLASQTFQTKFLVEDFDIFLSKNNFVENDIGEKRSGTFDLSNEILLKKRK